MEKIFGTYYDDTDFNDKNLPDNTNYLKKQGVFSYHSNESQQIARQFREKIEAGETVYLLGMNVGHNSGVSVIEASKKAGIQVLANYEEERFVAIKHFSGYPDKSVKAIKVLLSRIRKNAQRYILYFEWLGFCPRRKIWTKNDYVKWKVDKK
jgi:hypothetical protein